MKPLSALWLILVAGATGLPAAPVAAAPDDTSGRPIEDARAPTLDAFLDARRDRYREALARASRWLDRLEVNPVELRARGVKGKKKVAELLDALLKLHGVADGAARSALEARIRALASMTATPGYHDMLRVDDQTFKEDATSYLRTAYRLDRFGLDTTLYRREIQRVLPRLNAHMAGRGVDQRMAFHTYYRHFNLPEPFPLAAAFQAGLIAARREAAFFKQHPMECYNLTHEIFAPYEFGESLDADFFTESDKTYLRQLLAELTRHALAADHTDLLAELTSCLRYLRFTGEPVYRAALENLLERQRPDGAWGDYENLRAVYGSAVEQGFYLHTTLVALDALTTAFSAP